MRRGKRRSFVISQIGVPDGLKCKCKLGTNQMLGGPLTNTGAAAAGANTGGKKQPRSGNFKGTNGNRWSVGKHHPGMTWDESLAGFLRSRRLGIELTQEFFARAAGVEISRVKEVSACLAVGFIDFLRFVLR